MHSTLCVDNGVIEYGLHIADKCYCILLTKGKNREKKAISDWIGKGEERKKLLNCPNRPNKLNWSAIADTTLGDCVTNKSGVLTLKRRQLLFFLFSLAFHTIHCRHHAPHSTHYQTDRTRN